MELVFELLREAGLRLPGRWALRSPSSARLSWGKRRSTRAGVAIGDCGGGGDGDIVSCRRRSLLDTHTPAEVRVYRPCWHPGAAGRLPGSRWAHSHTQQSQELWASVHGADGSGDSRRLQRASSGLAMAAGAASEAHGRARAETAAKAADAEAGAEPGARGKIGMARREGWE